MMQRKPGYPVANCNIKMPDSAPPSEAEEEEPQQRRMQLINFGHTQWGFNNWSWAVSKQDLDFVDLVCGKYTAGVAAFVTITVKTFDIHRENVGYATSVASTKGAAIHQARKCAVTNALRETLLSFGGSVGAELLELDAPRSELPAPDAPPPAENNQNLPNLPAPPKPPSTEPKNSPHNRNGKNECAAPRPPPHPMQGGPLVQQFAPPAVKNAPVAKAHPMPANLPPAANRPAAAPPAPAPAAPPAPRAAPPAPAAPHPRPNSNEARADSSEARAERKRRQRLAQAEFRLKQLQRLAHPTHEEKAELEIISTSVDNLLMAIPIQDINKKDGGTQDEPGKRKSPTPDGGAAKRRGNVLTRLDIS